MSANPYEVGPFRHVCDMENPLMEIKDFSFALMLLAGSLTSDGARAVNRLAIAINDSVCEAERLRSELFGLTHPNGVKQEGNE